MDRHHYLGAIPKIGETIWYVGTINQEWVSLLGFSASALRSKARNKWIGWSYRYHFDRLKLIVNNSRFLILPGWHIKNLASRIMSLCLKRIVNDWSIMFGHKIVLAETFVDPGRFDGTIYKASNWHYIGDTKGYSRTQNGYSEEAGDKK